MASLCIFCPNQRTNKRGEHVWDDWINRLGGKEIRDRSTTSYYGRGHKLIRSHPSVRLDVTLPVVCDECNNTWMSDISNRTKTIIEPSIRRDVPRDLDVLDILTLTTFAFMKSAVLDWSALDSERQPIISRAMCLTFRDSLSADPPGDVSFPLGLQVWIARYRRRYVMEAQAFTEELTHSHHLKGYRVLIVTYVIGSFIFQIVCPRYAGLFGKRSPPPYFTIINDERSALIWPDVTFASWPPSQHVDGSTLENFRERFRHVRILSR